MNILYNPETAAAVFSQRESMARTAVTHRRVDVAHAALIEDVPVAERANYLTWEATNRAGLALAHAEGVLSVYSLAKGIATRYTGEEAMARLQQFAVDTLTQPPGDTYSGRTNDARRSFNDGQREAASGIVRRF